MANIIILHGFTSNPNSNFFPWLVSELKKSNHTASVPELPNTDNPTEKEQVDFVLKNTRLTPDSIVLGHSLGAVVALKIAENHPITGVVLVGGFLSPNFKDKKRPFEAAFSWSFDFKKIKANAKKILVLSDRNDYAIPLEQGRELAEKLSATLIETTAQEPHFTNDVEPMVLGAMKLIQ